MRRRPPHPTKPWPRRWCARPIARRARGGLAAAAAFLQRAAELTPDPGLRVERSLAAAQAKLEVADAASASSPVDGGRARAARRSPAREARAAARAGRVPQPARARRAAAAARSRADGSSRSTPRWRATPTSRASRRRCSPDGSAPAPVSASWPRPRRGSTPVRDPGAADLLLDGLVVRFTDGYAAAVEPLSQALRTLRDLDGEGDAQHWLWLACRLAQDLWDDELWFALATCGVRVARDTGALTLLPNALNHLAALDVHSGAFAAAAALTDEVRLIAQATGLPPLDYSRYKLAATRGDRAAVQALVDGPIKGVRHSRRGLGLRRAPRAPGAHAQQHRPVRQGARRCARGMRVRRGDRVQRVARGTRRGRSAYRPRRTMRLRRSTVSANARARLAPRGRSASKRAVGRCCTTTKRAHEEAIAQLTLSRAVGRAGAEPARVRRVAPAREPSGRRARAAACRTRELQPHGCRRVRRAGAPRAPRHR